MTTLRLSPEVFQFLTNKHLSDKKEHFSFAIAREIHTHKVTLRGTVLSLALTGNLFIPEQFISSHSVEICADEHQQVVARAIEEAKFYSHSRVYILNIHDHWFSNEAVFSSVDDRSDRELAKTYDRVSKEAGIELIPVSIVIGKTQWAARIPVRMPTGEWGFHPVRLLVNDIPIRRLDSTVDRYPDMLHSRQPWLQDADPLIKNLNVAVVGCGGSGSIAAEGLVRMGFRRLTLIDADRVEYHNLNRLQGAGEGDIGKPKIQVVAEHLKRIFPDTDIETCMELVYQPDAQQHLRDCDLILGCVDNNESRWYLNQTAVHLNLPYLDIGSRIFFERGGRRDATRVSIIVPGRTPCGYCTPQPFYEKKVPERFVNKNILAEQRKSGYCTGSDNNSTPAEQIYSLNMRAVSDLLDEVSLLVSGSSDNAAFSVFTDGVSGKRSRLRVSDLPASMVNHQCAFCATVRGDGVLPVDNKQEVQSD
ncbi:hypothetical protein DI392_17980 [Vibrio albus]|uniref:THIF-type NAD/FAD binding fold domain-containing protein n=1 Tax=Vibrio albus TaxID=2200953 RepID=A0A2U3B543_9VIBR|nr:ThiF family adenylyltransferase [Vibrio albus]PWI31921.1 hypothetical protein DI392_17980 [Vibrio albus]